MPWRPALTSVRATVTTVITSVEVAVMSISYGWSLLLDVPPLGREPAASAAAGAGRSGNDDGVQPVIRVSGVVQDGDGLGVGVAVVEQVDQVVLGAVGGGADVLHLAAVVGVLSGGGGLESHVDLPWCRSFVVPQTYSHLARGVNGDQEISLWPPREPARNRPAPTGSPAHGPPTNA